MQSYKNVQIIAKEGYKHILLALALFLFVAYADFCNFCQLLFFALFIFTVYFFRNPEVETVDDSRGSVISPVDGTIESIELFEERSKVVVRIRNSVLDTHIIRAPLGASVKNVQRRSGMALWGDDKKSEVLNSRCSVEIGDIMMNLKAEFFPYDIELGIGASDKVKHGQRIGFIYGGTVEMELPYSINLHVDIGEKVKSSQNIIGTYKSK